MKTISIFLALVNSLLAALLITFLVSSVDIQYSPSWWSAARIIIALSVIVIGVITWAGSIGHVNPGLMALCSLALVALGAATTVWTFHRAQLSGDMEYYMIIYGGSLFIQGVALLFGLSSDQDSTSVA
ncbi:MAG: hypothetical protein ABI621_15805 [Chloroflexota bacterium]